MERILLRALVRAVREHGKEVLQELFWDSSGEEVLEIVKKAFAGERDFQEIRDFAQGTWTHFFDEE